MFYVKDKYIPYPSKTIEEDVLTKIARDDEEFTPFEPMKGIMLNYLQRKYHDSDAVKDQCIREIIRNKFDPSKVKPTDESAFTRDNDEAKTLTEDEFYYYLEEINSSYIEQWIGRRTYSFTNYRESSLATYKAENISVNSFTDNDDEDIVISESDLKIADNHASDAEIRAAKKELPYLIKQLHQGSILLQGSLMSFIIARERAIKDNDGKSSPGIYFNNTYGMSPSGNITHSFTENDNKHDPFRNLAAWADGDQNARGLKYREYYDRLMNVLDVLKIDITEEDPMWFTRDNIQRITCLYLESNMRLMPGTNFKLDENVFNILSPDKLMSSGLSNVDIDNITLVGRRDPLPPKSMKSISGNKHSAFRHKYRQYINTGHYLFADDRERVARALSYTTTPEEYEGVDVYGIASEDGILVGPDGREIYIELDYTDRRTAVNGFLTVSGLVIMEATYNRIEYYDVDVWETMEDGESRFVLQIVQL